MKKDSPTIFDDAAIVIAFILFAAWVLFVMLAATNRVEININVCSSGDIPCTERNQK